MREIILYKAVVVDDNDKDKLGKVKIRVLPEMEDVKEDDLPWALPFGGIGMNDNNYIFNPPVKDTHIWVFFLDKYFQEPYYIQGRFIEGLFDYDNKIKSPISKIKEVGGLDYPNPRAILLDDGSLLFYNTETKEKGIYNQNGTYIFINKDGKLYVYFKDQLMKIYNDNLTIELKDDGTVSVSNGSGNFSLKSSGQVDINGHLTVDS